MVSAARFATFTGAGERVRAVLRREIRVSRGETFVGVVIVLHCQPQVLEVVGALHAARRFTRSLDGGEKQPDQNTDDRDDDKQFDEGKAVMLPYAIITEKSRLGDFLKRSNDMTKSGDVRFES